MESVWDPRRNAGDVASEITTPVRGNLRCPVSSRKPAHRARPELIGSTGTGKDWPSRLNLYEP
ncbi:hypothetical protein RHCRD62_100111 [Rhodococcus sp. RD6.2]|nr:hypothetical protein RHCRD62_100111 [Rhodococcus sp. RD6.2]